MESGSFIVGALCGGVVIAIVAFIANQIRVQLVARGLKTRSFDQFPTSRHPDLTPQGVVNTSRGASVTLVLLSILLIAFLGMVFAGCYYFVLQA